MRTQPDQKHPLGERVIPFPASTNKAASLTCTEAIRGAIDSGVFAALRDAPYGPAAQAVYMVLLRRLPNVAPSAKRIADDSGVSLSTVYRVLDMLKQAQLVLTDSRGGKPRSARYEVTDLNHRDYARTCLARLRQITTRKAGGQSIRKANPRSEANSGECDFRVDAKGAGDEIRVGAKPLRSGATGNVAWARTEGTNKIQSKSQAAKPPLVGDDLESLREEIQEALRRWGISNPGYLLDPNNEAAIPELVQQPRAAVQLIDRAMNLRQWTPRCGPGLRVKHLQTHICEAVGLLERDRLADRKHRARLVAQAKTAVDRLPRCENHSTIDEMPPHRLKTLLRKGSDALGIPRDVLSLLIRDDSARTRIVAYELRKELIAAELDTMSHDELEHVKAEVLDGTPRLKPIFISADPRSSTMRSLMIEWLLKRTVQN